ncbi:MAG: NUDIX domain-containing protein [Coleofasciculaceae cyanobacterium]
MTSALQTTDSQFPEKPHEYKYSRPALTVDCVVFGLDEQDTLKVLIIRRDRDPFEDNWAFPGGFVRVEKDQSLDDAARRELEEETGVTDVFLEQLYTFSAKDRDPREWVVSVAYYALINLSEHPIQAASDAREAAWFPITDLPALAFDHKLIMDKAIARLRSKVRYEPIGFELLPKKFTLPQLQKLYETILGVKLDRRNFLRKFRKMDLLIDLNETQKGVSHRAAKFYQFDAQKYAHLKEKGFNFEV